MTFRELYVLLEGLPLESMYKSKLLGTDGQARWSMDTYILASLNDMALAQYAIEFSKAGQKPPASLKKARILRPGEKREERQRDAEADNNAKTLLDSLSVGNSSAAIGDSTFRLSDETQEETVDGRGLIKKEN